MYEIWTFHKVCYGSNYNKLFYDFILFWPVTYTKSDKNSGHISQKNLNTLKSPKRYSFCFGQKNRAGLQLQQYYEVLPNFAVISIAYSWFSLFFILSPSRLICAPLNRRRKIRCPRENCLC